MTGSIIPFVGQPPADGVVTSAYLQWSGLALQAFQQAQTLANGMASVQITPINFNTPWTYKDALTAFPTLPSPGFSDKSQFKVSAGTLVSPPSPVWGTYTPQVGDLPAFTVGDVGQFNAPQKPSPVTLLPMPTAPTLTSPTLPVSPNYVLPTPPTLDVFTVPAIPTIVIPTFTAAAPVFNVPIPNQNFSFTPGQYVDSLLTTTEATITAMQSGQFVLPAAVISALRNRAFDAANREETRGVDQAIGEFASRGFEEFPGLLNRRIAEIRGEARLSRSAANRDVYIQDQQAAVENLREGVKSGVALEGQLIQLYTVQTQLQFEAAKFALESAMQIFNARVSAFNAQVNEYGVQAQVFREQMQGVLAQVQVYHTQLEALRVRGELNQQQVAIYNAQLAGVNELVEIYKAQLAGAEVQVKINQENVDVFVAQIGAVKAQAEVQGIQWQTYRTSVDAEVARAQFYQTAVNAYSARIQGWAAKESTLARGEEINVEIGKAQIESWRAQMQAFEAQLQAEIARITAVKDAIQADTEVYKANASVAASAAEFDNRRVQLNIEIERARVDTAIKTAEQNFEQMKYITSTLIELKKTLTTVQSQLAASAMNAVNIGASMTASTQQSLSWNTNVSGTLDS